jgi:N-methylhydantoinase B
MSESFAPTFDAIGVEVVRNALQSIAEEMAATLIRASFSTNIKDRRDCSCAIYVGPRMLAQGEHIPYHLGFMHVAGRILFDDVPLVRSLRPGDVLVTNDPWITGTHLCDIMVYAPVFDGPDVVAFVANMAHHADVGGITPGSCPPTATSILHEGVRIPPVLLRSSGVWNDSVISLISSNLRSPRVFRGDIAAQVAANDLAVSRVADLVQRYGRDGFETYSEMILEYSERRMRSAIAALPDGVSEFSDVIEGDAFDASPVTIRCRVEVSGDEVTIDFTGTDPQVRGSVNAPPGLARSCAYFAVKAIADPDVPSNDGAYLPITVITEEGTLLHARPGAAVSNANPITGMRVADTIFGAFGGLATGRVGAASSGSLSAVLIGGPDPRSGEQFAYIETYGGGQGAFPDMDGMNAVMSTMSNTRNAPVESLETDYPFLIERYSLREGTGGVGDHGGGVGMTREIRILSPTATVSICGDRGRIAPWGAAQGGDAATAQWLVRPAGGGAEQSLASKTVVELSSGDVLVIHTAGGGGYGPPVP